MGLETGEFIADLVQTNPVTATDPVTQGADHLRLIKKVLQQSLGDMPGLLQFPDNDQFLTQSNLAGNGFVNMIRVNLDDAVEIGNGFIIDGIHTTTAGDLTISGILNVSGSSNFAGLMTNNTGEGNSGFAMISSDAAIFGVWADDGASVRIEQNGSTLRFYTGGDPGSASAAGSSQAMSLSNTTQLATMFAGLTVAAGDLAVSAGRLVVTSLPGQATLTLNHGDAANIFDINKTISGGGSRITFNNIADATLARISMNWDVGFGRMEFYAPIDAANDFTPVLYLTAAGAQIPNGDLVVTSNIIATDISSTGDISSAGDITAFAV